MLNLTSYDGVEDRVTRCYAGGVQTQALAITIILSKWISKSIKLHGFLFYLYFHCITPPLWPLIRQPLPKDLLLQVLASPGWISKFLMVSLSHIKRCPLPQRDGTEDGRNYSGTWTPVICVWSEVWLLWIWLTVLILNIKSVTGQWKASISLMKKQKQWIRWIIRKTVLSLFCSSNVWISQQFNHISLKQFKLQTLNHMNLVCLILLMCFKSNNIQFWCWHVLTLINLPCLIMLLVLIKSCI